jgi:hypothetical protein
MANEAKEDRLLNKTERILAAMLGLFFLAAAGFIFWQPPLRTQFEISSAENSKFSFSNPETQTLVLALLICGIVLCPFAINGVRIFRLGFKDYSVDGAPPNPAEVRDVLAKNVDKLKQENQAADDQIPEPAAIITPTVNDASGEPFSVLKTSDLPDVVLKDAFLNWPSSDSPPKNLSDLDFALRKKGKGNHPWILKFQGKKPVVISYGGQGKTAPSVDWAA